MGFTLGTMHTTVRTQQLIASLKKFTLSTKTLLKDPKKAVRQIGVEIRTYFSEFFALRRNKRTVIFAVPIVLLLGISIILIEAPSDLHQMEINEAGFFDKPTPNSFHKNEYQRLVTNETLLSDNQAVAEEALLWMSVLKSYDELSLSNHGLMMKFKNMGIASTILSMTADGPLRRKYWSEKAIKYSRYALGVLEGMFANPQLSDLEEVKTRLLIAMALNYYEDGETEEKEIVGLFKEISSSFIVRTGFCNNKILKLLHDDKIIELPNHLSRINL